MQLSDRKKSIRDFLKTYLFDVISLKVIITIVTLVGSYIGFYFYIEQIPGWIGYQNLPWNGFLLFFIPDCPMVAFLFLIFLFGPKEFEQDHIVSVWGVFYGLLFLNLFRNGFLAIFFSLSIPSSLWQWVVLSHAGLVLEAIALFFFVDINHYELGIIIGLTIFLEGLDFFGWFIVTPTLIQLEGIYRHLNIIHNANGLEFFFVITITMDILSILLLLLFIQETESL